LHHDFKRAQGYSDMEIARKRAALERCWSRTTSRPTSIGCADAGFRRIERWFQCLNFVGWLARD
jgi:tRNA (cmo5U34)-methyltransferase